MKQFNLVKNNKAKLEAINDKIHKWLLKNREGYNAEKWGEVIENDSVPGEFTLSLPPEDSLVILNSERVGMKEGKLEDKWFKKVIMDEII